MQKGERKERRGKGKEKIEESELLVGLEPLTLCSIAFFGAKSISLGWSMTELGLLEKERRKIEERNNKVGQNSVLSMFWFGTLESTDVNLNQMGSFSVMPVVCVYF